MNKRERQALNMTRQSSVPSEVGPAWSEEQRLRAQDEARRVLVGLQSRGLLTAPPAWDGSPLDFYASVLGL